MKINRFIALTIIALLVVGAMGVISFKVLARPVAAPEIQTQPCDQPENDSAEVQDPSDTDDNEGQCGDEEESEADDDDDMADSAEANKAEEQAPAQTRVTAEQAKSIAELANPGATALAVEFEREGGRGIWEVELDNGLEVEIDANSGVILGAESVD